jgi:hypothetical protein
MLATIDPGIEVDQVFCLNSYQMIGTTKHIKTVLEDKESLVIVEVEDISHPKRQAESLDNGGEENKTLPGGDYKLPLTHEVAGSGSSIESSLGCYTPLSWQVVRN